VISADCIAGNMHGVDGFDVRYGGTWPAGGPGAGRPKFNGWEMLCKGAPPPPVRP